MDHIEQPAREAYNAAVQQAREAYDAVVQPAREAYNAAVQQAREAYDAAEKRSKMLKKKDDIIKCPYCNTQFKYNGRYYELQECPQCHSKLLI